MNESRPRTIPESTSRNTIRLTQKQRRFADAIIAGETQTAAYRAAFDAANMRPATIWSEASRLRKHPQVTARVQAVDLRLLGEAERLRRLVLTQLEREATAEDNPAAVRVAACRALGETTPVGLFDHRSDVELKLGEVDPEEIRARLLEQLLAILDDSQTQPAIDQLCIAGAVEALDGTDVE